METYTYKDVVVIGNGPSGITLSYMLAGNWPYYNGEPHPIDFMQYRLEENKNQSILEQDLQQLSEGLVGRSSNPVSVLFDTLNHPMADVGCENPSALCWKNCDNSAINHVVLGKGTPAASWQKMDGNSLTISLGSWMQLPALNIHNWNHNTKRSGVTSLGLRQKRATVKTVANYYKHYVDHQKLQKYFIKDSIVTSVSKVTEPSALLEYGKSQDLWKVSGQKLDCGIISEFTYVSPNVVLATGNSDHPNRLNVEGEDFPFVLHSLSELSEVIASGDINSGNLLIVGAGLSAADAIITARFHSIPIIHIFRRSVHDRELIFNKLPENVYPEYHKVHQMMQDSNHERYDGYKSFSMYRIGSISANRMVTLLPCSEIDSPCVVQVSHVLILTGMHPDLSFLPHHGKNLGIYPNLFIDCKNNPVDIDLYSHESVYEPGLYAVGPLVGDNFVRFVQGGCLAAVSHIMKKL